MPVAARILNGHLVPVSESIDSVYFSGYILKLQIPGKLVSFLVKQGKHPVPSPAIPGKMADRLAGPVVRYAQEHNVLIVHFDKWQRKVDFAARHRTKFGKEEGVVHIGVGQGRTAAFKTENRFPSSIFQPLSHYPLWRKSRYLLHPSPCSNLQSAIRHVSTDPPEYSAIPSGEISGKGRSRDRFSW